MLEEIKGIFFDLDDTLINFSGVTIEAWQLTCEKAIEKHPELEIDATVLAKTIIEINEAYWADEEKIPKGNVDIRKIRKDIITQAFKILELDNAIAITFLLDNYAVYKERAIYVLPNVHKTLHQLKEKGYQLVLITNGDGNRQRHKIARFALEEYFDAILIEGEQAFGKPDHRIYQKALDICKIEATQACMVGDNYLWEVETPIRYGMKGVWLNFLNKSIPENATVEPTLEIKNISELLQ